MVGLVAIHDWRDLREGGVWHILTGQVLVHPDVLAVSLDDGGGGGLSIGECFVCESLLAFGQIACLNLRAEQRLASL